VIMRLPALPVVATVALVAAAGTAVAADAGHGQEDLGDARRPQAVGQVEEKWRRPRLAGAERALIAERSARVRFAS